MSNMREAFEKEAAQYGFDLTRYECAAPEPWSEYVSEATGHRWAGYQAAIAAVKEGGSKAYIYTRDQDKGTGWLTFNPPEYQDPDQMAELEVVIDRLYKLPEDV